eukprot:symbB.v1.2.034866.t1/scaffold4574.1/size37803/1
MDPWPLLRELRYRTCLEYPKLEEWTDLEQKYLKPLRSLRGPWWKQPEALELLAKQLDEVGFVIIDDFMPEEMARAVKASNVNLYQQSEMEEGATTGGSERVGIPHRGDVLKWIGYDGATEASRCVSAFVDHIEKAVQSIGNAAQDVAPKVATAVSSIQWRSETMLTCYPAAQRARYFRHTDNSSGNGRLLTALVYLNENWKQGDGGELRLFYPGEKNLKVRMEVEPLWNRLLLFWSDDRSPHEVLSTCQDRFAATVWFYDQTNPGIPLTEVGSTRGRMEQMVPTEPTPAPLAAAPAKQVETLPAEDSPQKVIMFYDGSDAEIVELSQSLDPKTLAKHVDLRDKEALEVLAAGEWLKSAESVDAVIQEAGPLFLCLPSGEVLKHGEKEQWMLHLDQVGLSVGNRSDFQTPFSQTCRPQTKLRWISIPLTSQRSLCIMLAAAATTAAYRKFTRLAVRHRKLFCAWNAIFAARWVLPACAAAAVHSDVSNSRHVAKHRVNSAAV